MKLLLLGRTGLLGSAIEKRLTKEKIDFLAPRHDTLDLASADSMALFFRKHPPEGFEKILHCAAWTDVDRAETEKQKCEAVNVVALERLLQYKIPILHFSTDYVFGAPSRIEIPENFPRDPQNQYGQSKAKAEILLERNRTPWWNVRTTWLVGMAGANFVSKILHRAERQSVIQVVSDEIGRPTFTDDLARHTIEHFVKQTPEKGHYHLQNSGPPVSRAELAEKILHLHGWLGTVTHISGKELSRPAKRPINSVLKNTKLPEMPDWRESLERYLEELNG